MLTFLDKIIGFVAPHHCLACGKDGSPLCSNCSSLLPDAQPRCYRCHNAARGSMTCQKCVKHAHIREVIVVTEYTSFAEDLIHKLKFERTYEAAHVVASIMASLLDPQEDMLIVPVPTATSRVRRRGYDQSVAIARALAKQTKLPCSAILRRYGQARQTGSSRKQRLDQLKDAFAVRTRKDITSRHIILVDDVMTTGATLESAAHALRKAGVTTISAITFARPE